MGQAGLKRQAWQATCHLSKKVALKMRSGVNGLAVPCKLHGEEGSSLQALWRLCCHFLCLFQDNGNCCDPVYCLSPSWSGDSARPPPLPSLLCAALGLCQDQSTLREPLGNLQWSAKPPGQPDSSSPSSPRFDGKTGSTEWDGGSEPHSWAIE